jgi:hypothetical protein
MIDAAKRLFVGIKISKALQVELDSPVLGTGHYFEAAGDQNNLQIITVGEHKFIGRYIDDGFPAAEIGDVSRNVSTMVKMITRGRRIEENDIQIYSS